MNSFTSSYLIFIFVQTFIDMSLPKVNPTTTKAWKKLETHFEEIRLKHLKELFKDESRFEKFHIKFNDFVFDYSKNRIDETTMKLLIELANECKLKEAIESQFKGNRINETENRPVLHIALRNLSNRPIEVDFENVMPAVNQVLQQMSDFSKSVISGQWKGFTGKEIKDIVNIGIGGSDLGPAMVSNALRFYKTRLNVHYVSNVDATHLVETLKDLNPETTLFIIASKTFTTQETMTNAYSAKKWFLESEATTKDIPKHFVAISTNVLAVEQFGINPENMFKFWDWVGGRFSLWSSIGLSICLAVGFENFNQLLKGAFEADEHFRISNFEENIPVIMGLLGIWYNNFFKAETHAVLPYSQYLSKFPTYLQQVDMESNGKNVDRNGQPVDYQTGAIIWGDAGTNGQHAFYQLIHQGTKLIPCDFIAASQPLNPLDNHHEKLLSNFFAQTKALAFGKEEKDLKNSEATEKEIEFINAFKVFEGNIPTNSILFKKLTPRNLGALIALYEHKTFVQGIIWNIFSYDQWGVELGKKLANEILPELKSNQETNSLDSSTNGLINVYKEMRKGF